MINRKLYKIIPSICLIVGVHSIANAQSGEVPPPPPTGMSIDKDEGKVFTFVEQQPEYPGGEAEMMKFLSENIKYPKDSKKKGITGTVFLTFVVNKTGKVEDVKIARGVANDLDEESVRVVKMMPNWKPAKMQGKPVSIQYNLPIKYTLR